MNHQQRILIVKELETIYNVFIWKKKDVDIQQY